MLPAVVVDHVACGPAEAAIAVTDAADTVAVRGAIAERRVARADRVGKAEDVAERVLGEVPAEQRRGPVGLHRGRQPAERVVGNVGLGSTGGAVGDFPPGRLACASIGCRAWKYGPGSSLRRCCTGEAPGRARAPRSQPRANASPVPIAATRAVEISGPIPGTLIRR